MLYGGGCILRSEKAETGLIAADKGEREPGAPVTR